MLPRFPANDRRDIGCRYAINGAQRCQRIIRAAFSDSSNIIRRKFDGVNGLTVSMAHAIHHVSRVLLVAAFNYVFRIKAEWDITRMASNGIWPATMRNPESQPVNRYQLVIKTTPTIALGGGEGPYETRFGAVISDCITEVLESIKVWHIGYFKYRSLSA
jgi:hypothetical protein